MGLNQDLRLGKMDITNKALQGWSLPSGHIENIIRDRVMKFSKTSKDYSQYEGN